MTLKTIKNRWKFAFFSLLIGSVVIFSGSLYLITAHFERQLKETISNTDYELQQSISRQSFLAKFILKFRPQIRKEDFEKELDEIRETLSGSKYLTLTVPDPDGRGIAYSLAGVKLWFDENGFLKTILVDDPRHGQNPEAIFYNKNFKDYLFWSYSFNSGGSAMWRAVMYVFFVVAGILFYSFFEIGSKNQKYIFVAHLILLFVLFAGFTDLFWYYNWQLIQIKYFAEIADSLPIYTFLEAGKVWVIYPTYLMNIIVIDFLLLLLIGWRSKKAFRISAAG